jgi:hypothetical protein
MPTTNAAPHAATSATDATTIRPIDLAVMIATLGQTLARQYPHAMILGRIVSVIKSAFSIRTMATDDVL